MSTATPSAVRSKSMRAPVGVLVVATLLASLLAVRGVAVAQTAPITLDQLKDATYPTDVTASKTATLLDGAYSEPAAPGSASKATVTFIDGAIGTGYAVAIIASSGGGSGTFYTLHVVTSANGKLSVGPALALGDRVKIGSVGTTGDLVSVAMTDHAPSDPLCCPTLQVIKTFIRNGDSLVASQVAPAPASTSTPAGTATPPAAAATGSAGLLGADRASATAELALAALAVLLVAGARFASNRR